MRTSGRKRLGFGLAAGLVVAGIVGVTSLTASGDHVVIGGGGPTAPVGTLRIDLGYQSGTVTFTPADDDLPRLTQALSVSTPCSTLVVGDIVEEGSDAVADGTLLQLTPTGGSSPNVQLPSTGLGVTDGANCGNPAGLVGPGETLKLSLGDFFDVTEDETATLIGSATLQIGKPHPQGGSLRLAYGAGGFGAAISIANGGQAYNVPERTNTTSITMASTATQSSRGLSLDGGTVLDLVTPLDYREEVFCNSEPIPAVGAGDAVIAANYQRLANGDKSEEESADDCDFVGVNLEIRPVDGDVRSHVFWDNSEKGLNNDVFQDVRAVVTIVWAGIRSDQPALLQTKINYEGDPTGVFVPVEWCESFDTDANEGVAPLIDKSENADENGPRVPWCLVSNTEVLEGGFILQTQVFYGAGDPVGMKFG